MHLDFDRRMRAVIDQIGQLREMPHGWENTRKEGSPQPKPRKGWKAGDKRPLNGTAVARLTLAQLEAEHPNEDWTLKKQNWANKNVAIEWQAIRLAIGGEENLPEDLSHDLYQAYLSVEKEVVRSGADKTSLAHQNKQLLHDNAALEVQVKKNKDYLNSRLEKAYNEQYYSGCLLEDFEIIEKENTDNKTAADKQRKLVKEYQIQVRSLEIERDNFKRIAEQKGTKGGEPTYADFSPDPASIPEGADEKTLLIEYMKISRLNWKDLLEEADDKKPVEILLVFHRFDIDVKEFIKNRAPLSPGVHTFTFCCFENDSDRRAEMFKEAAAKIHTQPIVVLTTKDISKKTRAKGQLVNLKPGSNAEKLKAIVDKSSLFHSYNPIEEGYRQIWIERTPA